MRGQTLIRWTDWRVKLQSKHTRDVLSRCVYRLPQRSKDLDSLMYNIEKLKTRLLKERQSWIIVMN